MCEEEIVVIAAYLPFSDLPAERESESVCVCVCVCEREREKERMGPVLNSVSVLGGAESAKPR